MYCENCGANVPDGDAFCQNCGERVIPAASSNNVMQAQMQPDFGQPAMQAQLQPESFEQPAVMQAQLQPDFGQPAMQAQLQPDFGQPAMQAQLQPDFGQPAMQAQLQPDFGQPAMQAQMQPGPYDQTTPQQSGMYAQPSGPVLMPYAEPAAPAAPSVFTQPNLNYSQPPVPVNGGAVQQQADNSGYNRPIGNGYGQTAANPAINQYSSTYRQSFSNNQGRSSVPASTQEGSTAGAIGLIFGIFAILIGIVGGITFGVIGAGVGIGLSIIGLILSIVSKKASGGINGTGGLAFSIMGIIICAIFFIACAAGGKRTWGYGQYGIIGGPMLLKDDVDKKVDDVRDTVTEVAGDYLDDAKGFLDSIFD